MRTQTLIALAALTGSLPFAAQAQLTLDVAATADNAFTLYLSKSITTTDQQILAGSNWPATFNNTNVALDYDTQYWLLVLAQDFGGPEMFIADINFGIDTLVGGATRIQTNTSDWLSSTSGFGLNPQTPVFLGNSNSPATWGTRTEFNGADFIWAPNSSNVAWLWTSFTTVADPNQTVMPPPGPVIPEPSALAGLAALALGLFHVARRRR